MLSALTKFYFGRQIEDFLLDLGQKYECMMKRKSEFWLDVDDIPTECGYYFCLCGTRANLGFFGYSHFPVLVSISNLANCYVLRGADLV